MEPFAESLLSAGPSAALMVAIITSISHEKGGVQREHLPRGEWQKARSSQSTTHPLAWTSLALFSHQQRGSHYTYSAGHWRYQKCLAFNECQSSFPRECAFCWSGRGRLATCTFCHLPDPLWPGLIRTLLSPDMSAALSAQSGSTLLL